MHAAFTALSYEFYGYYQYFLPIQDEKMLENTVKLMSIFIIGYMNYHRYLWVLSVLPFFSGQKVVEKHSKIYGYFRDRLHELP